MIEVFKALILGAVQGITEFLPVSSTGHLILFEKLLGVSQETYGLTFDAALHLGTLIALLWFFRKEWLELVPAGISFLKNRAAKSIQGKLMLFLFIGTVPGMILGLLLEKKVETVFRSPILVAVALILFSLVLVYVEKVGKKTREMKQLNVLDSVVIGLAQAIALVPGVSRSGITMATGMWRGLTREEAAKFAFLLSAPIITGAGGIKFIKTIGLFLKHQLPAAEIVFFVVGMIAAAIVGYLTIKYFLRFLSRHSLYPFIIYRMLLGFIVLGISLAFH